MKHDRPEPTKPLYKKPKQVKVSEQDSATIELFKKENIWNYKMQSFSR